MSSPRHVPHAQPSAPTDAFLDTAFGLGAQLCRDALWDGRRCTWLGPGAEPIDGDWKVVPRTYGPEFYHGTAGVALFLARLYRATGEPILRAVAEGAMRQAESRAEAIAPSSRVGFYTGWAGLAYAAVTLGTCFDDERWIETGRARARAMADEDFDAQPIDVLAGYAGAAVALLAIDRLCDDDALRALAVRCGEQLLARATRRTGQRFGDDPAAYALSWDTMGGSAQDHLTGFSHGTAGIAWALAELGAALDDSRFRDAARAAFRYERAWYSPQQENWPDLRDPTLMKVPLRPDADGHTLTYPLLWCHGAPGIGLSRVRGWRLLDDDALRAEADAALRATARDLQSATPSVANYSLCHGYSGNAELLIYAAQVFDVPAYHELAAQIGWHGIRTVGQLGLPWPSGVLDAPEAPSLMLGIAGTGYFYLRLHDPDATPSVLILPVDGPGAMQP
ncbi:MAG: lanthionine synthetase LanC family protein [Acidobacteriota bacterium]